ncbi:type III PLP-dependent enzyme [Cyanobacteria bacterium FACHB-471]|nr:type III PLP-dependent enzyme [Cyanobacteria bacterium FACHB-471]
MSQKIQEFLMQRLPPATPFLVIDLDIIKERFQALRQLFPDAQIYYAVKANPEPEILKLLVKLGANFDAASLFEIEQCLRVGASAQQISYGNPIKKAQDIAQAYKLGVRLFNFDSFSELEKLATHAPGSQVCCRILVETSGAEWSLSRKFGCESRMAYDLLLLSRSLGLNPCGISFHVGSQQTDPNQWDEPIRQASSLFSRLAERGINLSVLNLGGGFPAHYKVPILNTQAYATTIQDAMNRHFTTHPIVMLEPGRSLVADAGTIQTEVVLIAKKSYGDRHRWIFLDIGKFGGLIETLDECIRYRLRTPHDGSAAGPVILAGPTCDSADILYDKAGYELPLDLKIGDRIEILSTGAYTHTYSSVGFNGFPPLPVYCI